MLRFTVVCLLVSVVVGLELKAQIKDHWQSFKNSHKKSYTEAEENQRKEIFKKNVETVLKHNLNSDLGECTHQLGINEFSDMTHDEFVKKMLGLRADLSNRTSSRQAPVEARGNLPASMDYRQNGVITPVKNQGNCGSCWTFATTGALEAHYALNTGRLYTLSEQHLVDCSTNGNYGCDGGLPDNAFQYIIQNGGIAQSYCYPYETRVGSCRFNRNCVGATMRSFKDINYGDENDLLNAVATKGPVAIGIDAGQTDFQQYRSGVYYPRYCSQTPNHAVLAVGYGTENGTPYWLVKNSWGTSWGQSGYVKMARNAGNLCGVANLASYPIV